MFKYLKKSWATLELGINIQVHEKKIEIDQKNQKVLVKIEEMVNVFLNSGQFCATCTFDYSAT